MICTCCDNHSACLLNRQSMRNAEKFSTDSNHSNSVLLDFKAVNLFLLFVISDSKVPPYSEHTC